MIVIVNASSSKTPTGTAAAQRYASASQVVAALGRAGLACTGAYYGNPVVPGAASEASCNLSGVSGSTLIDVFPGTVSTATVLSNSVSTGTEQIFSAVGPNWWVQTDLAHARRITKLLGGRIVAGPWHPSSQQAASADPVVTVCQQFDGIYPKVSAILNADANDPSALTVNSQLNRYGDKMAHWAYVISTAVDNGTTSADVSMANDMGDAGIAVVQVAEPLPGVTHGAQTAIGDVDSVQADCSGLTG